jgi:uncharacterized membrane protein
MKMDYEKSKVSNPLTIIAIFCGITEIAGVGIMGIVEKNLQSNLLWFVMLFPTLLVICFFLTLLFKHEVFYSPNEYPEAEGFIKVLEIMREKNAKIKKEIENIDGINSIEKDKITNMIDSATSFVYYNISQKITDDEIHKIMKIRNSNF